MRTYKILYFFFFASIGAFQPYLALYLKRLGMDGAEIGLISTMRPIATLLGPILLVALAARFPIGRRLLPVLLGLSLIPALLFVTAEHMWLLLGLYWLLHFFKSPVIPLLDDATLRTAEGNKTSYGPVRLWGSVGFIFAVWGVGFAAERFGIQASLTAHAVTIALATLVAWGLVRKGQMPALAVESAGTGKLVPAAGLKMAWGLPDIRLAIIAGFLGRCAQMAQETFFAIHADQMGMSEQMIGLAWAIAVVGEVVLMALSPKLAGRFNARALFLLGIGAGCVRWAIYAWTASPMVLLSAQVLHAFTFGAFHVGAVTLLHERLPAHRRTEGQSAWTVVTSGLPGLLFLYPIGILMDAFGLRFVFAASAVLAFAGLMVGLRIRKTPYASVNTRTDRVSGAH